MKAFFCRPRKRTAAGIKYIGELVQKTEAEMLKTKNFGRKSLNEIKEILTEMGLGFGMKIDTFDPETFFANKKKKDGGTDALN